MPRQSLMEMNVNNDNHNSPLGVIANLLALQLAQDKNLVDATWLLRRAGMKNIEIGRVLGISERSVAAHISNKKKQIEQSEKTRERKKVNGE